MSFIIYAVNSENENRLNVGSIRQLSEMSKWLQTKGNKEWMYELWKTSLHSKWVWKENKNGWGRMATPSNKKIVDIAKTNVSFDPDTEICKTRGQSRRY